MTRTPASARAAGAPPNIPTPATEDPVEGHPRRRPVADRLLARCVLAGECIIWTGATRTDSGYGVIGLVIAGRHVTKSTHRVAYESFVGPIPAGLHIDHLCGNRTCVNPDHLEAVTQAVNNQRMQQANRPTHCKRGHEFTEENTVVIHANGRNCRICKNARTRQLRRERRLAA